MSIVRSNVNLRLQTHGSSDQWRDKTYRELWGEDWFYAGHAAELITGLRPEISQFSSDRRSQSAFGIAAFKALFRLFSGDDSGVWRPDFVEDPHEYERVDEEEDQQSSFKDESLEQGYFEDPGDYGHEEDQQAALKANGVNNASLYGTSLGFLTPLPSFKEGSPDEVPDDSYGG